MSESALDAALDQLYGADPGDFVAIRKRLSSELRTAGHKDAAKELQAARRPSTAAWALNQLARVQPDVVERLLDRSSELQAAQTRAVSGKPEALREAMRAHRQALDDATLAALAILGDRANDAFRSEIVSTLRAASADDDTGRLLRAGRLTREAEFQGFPDATGLTLVPQPAESKQHTGRSREKPDTATASGSEATEAAQAAEAAEVARVERERQASRKADVAAQKAARHKAEAAEANVKRAEARVERLHNELEVAQRALDAARARSEAATQEVARLDQPRPKK
jgi:hypothetical protein